VPPILSSLEHCVLAIALLSVVLAAPARADWAAPTDLSPVGSPDGPPCQTGEPSVAAAPDGSFLVAWQRKLDDQGDANTVIEARRIAPDGTPGPLLEISDTPGNLDDAQAAVRSDGSGIVIWHELPGGACGQTSGPIKLQARRVSADGQLGPEIPVSQPSDKALASAVVMHPSGDATVAWVDQLSFGQAQLKARQLPLAGPPGPVAPLTSANDQVQEVDLVVDPLDRTLAVWNEHGLLQAQRLSPSGQPVAGVTDLTAQTDTSAELDVGIAANGQARVTWVRFTPEPISVLTRTIALDGTLGPPDEVAGGGDRPVGPRVAVNAGGAAALVWFTSPTTNAPDFAFGRTISSAGALAPPLTLSAPGGPVDMSPTVTLDDEGTALAVWQRNRNDGTGVVEAASFSRGDVIGAATPLSQPASDLLSPDLAGNPAGGALAAWGQDTDDGTGIRIQASRFVRPAKPPAEPSTPASSTPSPHQAAAGRPEGGEPLGASAEARFAALDILTRKARVSRSGLFTIRLRCRTGGVADCTGPLSLRSVLAVATRPRSRARLRKRVAGRRITGAVAGRVVSVRLRLAERALHALDAKGRLAVTATTRTRQPGEPAKVKRRSIGLLGSR
jgi:hypothetical protein